MHELSEGICLGESEQGRLAVARGKVCDKIWAWSLRGSLALLEQFYKLLRECVEVYENGLLCLEVLECVLGQGQGVEQLGVVLVCDLHEQVPGSVLLKYVNHESKVCVFLCLVHLQGDGDDLVEEELLLRRGGGVLFGLRHEVFWREFLRNSLR